MFKMKRMRFLLLTRHLCAKISVFINQYVSGSKGKIKLFVYIFLFSSKALEMVTWLDFLIKVLKRRC